VSSSIAAIAAGSIILLMAAAPALGGTDQNTAPVHKKHHVVARPGAVPPANGVGGASAEADLAGREAEVAKREAAVSQKEAALATAAAASNGGADTAQGASSNTASATQSKAPTGHGPFAFLHRRSVGAEGNGDANSSPTAAGGRSESEPGKAEAPKASNSLANWTPTYDHNGVNPQKFDRDLADCRNYAAEAPGTNGRKEATRAAKKWGLWGVAITGVAAVATGGLALIPVMGGMAAANGAVGALAGGGAASAAADSKYRGVISTCLTGRGYKVFE